MVQVIKVIRRCHYCQSDMTDVTSAVSYAQNPFCNACQSERASKYRRSPSESSVELVGDYFYFTQPPRKAS